MKIQKLVLSLVMLFSLNLSAQMIPTEHSRYSGAEQVGNHPKPPNTGAYYDWGRGRDGTGYCYQFTSQGYVLNGGYPVDEQLCESIKPSHFNWARGQNGYGYCYQFTPDELVMQQGRPQQVEKCEAKHPSYFSWGTSQQGWTYCYQFTTNHLLMNEGRPVPNEKCY